MTLPASLRWVEVDLPEILQYKSELLRLPFMLRLMSLLPQPRGPNRIWSGVCRLQRKR